MFDSLAEKLQATLADVRSHGTLSEADIDAALREIRLALLEADVNFKVVKGFTKDVKERCEGAEIVGKLNPGQQVVKIVNEELTALMGGASAGLSFSPRPPTVILMAGLQGSGKTTATPSSRVTYARSTPHRWRWPLVTSTVPPRSTSWSRSAPRPARRYTSKVQTAIPCRSPPGRWSARAKRARMS
jgi:hypothetical protein